MSRISELSNELSASIDECASVADCLRILERVDGQLFGGFMQYERLAGDRCCETLAAIVDVVERWRRQSSAHSVALVMSGAGTSGRLAFLNMRRFRRTFSESSRVTFHYLNAGGEAGLIEAQEHAEDNVVAARSDLQNIVDSIRRTSPRMANKLN
jgi:N-acetylmuramic acid 6-phosphate (MurNAc-6-P) etherase